MDPVSSATAVHKRPNRSVLLLLGAAGLFMLISVVSLLLRGGDGDETLSGPFTLADEFVSRLKYGEELVERGAAQPRMGFAAAHELLSPQARERLPFEDFYQLFLLRQNDHGFILSSRMSNKGVLRGGRDAFAEYELSFGRDSLHTENLHRESLRLTLVRTNSGWTLGDCSFLTTGVEGR